MHDDPSSYRPVVTPSPLRVVETEADLMDIASAREYDMRRSRRRESTLMGLVVWGVIVPAVVLLALAYALWWAHSGER